MTTLHTIECRDTEADLPVRKELVCDPTTGSVKPFEIWAHYASGRKRRLASFATEAAALKSHWWH